MVVDNQCAGIPAQDKPVYQEEAKQCVRKAVVPSKVLSMFQERQHSVKRKPSSVSGRPWSHPRYCPCSRRDSTLSRGSQAVCQEGRGPIQGTVHVPGETALCQEEAKQCVRKAVVPSKVLSMFQ